jgi:15-cis-phytoene synthase
MRTTFERLGAAPSDLTVCHEALRVGSKSFHAASLLLPRRLRAPVAALYAFCRAADDAVDEAGEGDEGDAKAGLAALRYRLDRIYAGAPRPDPVDRAFAQVVAEYRLPRAAPELLLEGFEWDVRERRYPDPSTTVAYGVRVASTVGVMMTVLMGPRDRNTLARACELGIAMQLTNIARDVGEDAGRGRLYLPERWLAEAGVDPDAFLAAPAPTEGVRQVTRRLLALADDFYRRSEAGVGRLPWRARLAIRAAGLIYRDIGRVIAANDFDSVTRRAYTGRLRKGWLAVRALGALFWRRQAAEAPPAPEARALVNAVER